MGYNLTIGNARLHYYPEYQHLCIEAEPAQHPDAPDHDPYTGKGNSRSPSYTAWHDFCLEAGIEPLFYGGGWDRDLRAYRKCPENFHRERPLLVEHPGVQPLCRRDLEYVKAARLRREATNGGREPGFWDDDGKDNGKDPTLARLLWLEFWLKWALDNCAIPVLENT